MHILMTIQKSLFGVVPKQVHSNSDVCFQKVNIGQEGEPTIWNKKINQNQTKLLMETKQRMDEVERSETFKFCIFSLSPYNYFKK